jgi:hypothetical protein
MTRSLDQFVLIKASDAKPHVRFTPKADMCGATGDVRFGPKADILAQKVMSALPPKADICSAVADVRSGPIADIQEFDSLC